MLHWIIWSPSLTEWFLLGSLSDSSPREATEEPSKENSMLYLEKNKDCFAEHLHSV